MHPPKLLTLDTAKIITERKTRAWSQAHLAHVARVSVRTIQNIESGKLAMPTTVRRIARAFGVEPRLLLATTPTAHDGEAA